MSKMFKVFVKDEAGKLEECAYTAVAFIGNQSILVTFSEWGIANYIYWQKATLFSDLDMSKPIPNEVQCVVCTGVPNAVFHGGEFDGQTIRDNLYEGDIVQYMWHYSPHRKERRMGVIVLDDLEWRIRANEHITHPFCEEKSTDAHILTHRIEDGKVVER